MPRAGLILWLETQWNWWHGKVRFQSWDQDPVHGTPACTPWGQGPWWAVNKLRRKEEPDTISATGTGGQRTPFWWWGVSWHEGERIASPALFNLACSPPYSRESKAFLFSSELISIVIVPGAGDQFWGTRESYPLMPSKIKQIIHSHDAEIKGNKQGKAVLLLSSNHQLLSFLGTFQTQSMHI